MRRISSVSQQAAISRRSVVDGGFAFEHGEIRPILLASARGDAIVFLEQRAADDLGRMRGEHQLDAQMRTPRRSSASADTPAFDQAPERLVARAALRPAIRRAADTPGAAAIR